MLKDTTNYYKLAPTFLFNSKGETKSFKTQEDVDRAWEDGWFGPRNLMSDSPLISSMEFDTKQELLNEVEGDARYKGLGLKIKDKLEDLWSQIIAFESEEI